MKRPSAIANALLPRASSFSESMHARAGDGRLAECQTTGLPPAPLSSPAKRRAIAGSWKQSTALQSPPMLINNRFEIDPCFFSYGFDTIQFLSSWNANSDPLGKVSFTALAGRGPIRSHHHCAFAIG